MKQTSFYFGTLIPDNGTHPSAVSPHCLASKSNFTCPSRSLFSIDRHYSKIEKKGLPPYYIWQWASLETYKTTHFLLLTWHLVIVNSISKCHYFFLVIDLTQSRQFSFPLSCDWLLSMPPDSGQDEDKSHYLLHLISFNKYVAGTYTNSILPAVLFLTILLSCCFYRWHLGMLFWEISSHRLVDTNVGKVNSEKKCQLKYQKFISHKME